MDGDTYCKRNRFCILLFLTVLVKIVQRCDSGVVVSLHLDQFINPGSRVWDGSCCNVLRGLCGPCYYDFQICVSRLSSYPYIQTDELHCDHGVWHTGMITPHNDSFYLPSRFPSGLLNPLKIIVPYWEGTVLVTIKARDIGMLGNDDDLVIEYTVYLTDWHPGRTEHDSTLYNWLLARYGISLAVEYAVYCQPNYYGRFCRVYCQPPTYFDRYTCDTTTGQKICHRGYTGFDCRRKVWPINPFSWWMTATQWRGPPETSNTMLAAADTSTASSSTTTRTTATTDMPISTLHTRNSTMHMFFFKTHIPTSTTDTPTSSKDTPTSSTAIPTSTTDIPTSTTDTPTSTVHTPTSTTDTPTSTTHTPTSTTHTRTSTKEIPRGGILSSVLESIKQLFVCEHR